MNLIKHFYCLSTPMTRWMWVWVYSRSWWWTGRPGVLPFIGSQRVRHDWATELNWPELIVGSLGKSSKFVSKYILFIISEIKKNLLVLYFLCSYLLLFFNLLIKKHNNSLLLFLLSLFVHIVNKALLIFPILIFLHLFLNIFNSPHNT